jgi:DNA-directed RNA polymerase subunit M/transcription elongation factor TFIIS
LRECPKCSVWMFDFDPRTKMEKCYNCGYEKKITNVREYYIRHDATYKLFLSSSEKTVEADKAFFFCISSGVSVGEKAMSLQEFANKVKEVDFESFKFHLVRGDFEKWVADVIGDSKLAEKIRKLREENHVDSMLRDRLFKTILASSIK